MMHLNLFRSPLSLISYFEDHHYTRFNLTRSDFDHLPPNLKKAAEAILHKYDLSSSKKEKGEELKERSCLEFLSLLYDKEGINLEETKQLLTILMKIWGDAPLSATLRQRALSSVIKLLFLASINIPEEERESTIRQFYEILYKNERPEQQREWLEDLSAIMQPIQEKLLADSHKEKIFESIFYQSILFFKDLDENLKDFSENYLATVLTFKSALTSIKMIEIILAKGKELDFASQELNFDALKEQLRKQGRNSSSSPFTLIASIKSLYYKCSPNTKQKKELISLYVDAILTTQYDLVSRQVTWNELRLSFEMIIDASQSNPLDLTAGIPYKKIGSLLERIGNVNQEEKVQFKEEKNLKFLDDMKTMFDSLLLKHAADEEFINQCTRFFLLELVLHLSQATPNFFSYSLTLAGKWSSQNKIKDKDARLLLLSILARTMRNHNHLIKEEKVLIQKMEKEFSIDGSWRGNILKHLYYLIEDRDNSKDYIHHCIDFFSYLLAQSHPSSEDRYKQEKWQLEWDLLAKISRIDSYKTLFIENLTTLHGNSAQVFPAIFEDSVIKSLKNRHIPFETILGCTQFLFNHFSLQLSFRESLLENLITIGSTKNTLNKTNYVSLLKLLLKQNQVSQKFIKKHETVLKTILIKPIILDDCYDRYETRGENKNDQELALHYLSPLKSLQANLLTNFDKNSYYYKSRLCFNQVEALNLAIKEVKNLHEKAENKIKKLPQDYHIKKRCPKVKQGDLKYEETKKPRFLKAFSCSLSNIRAQDKLPIDLLINDLNQSLNHCKQHLVKFLNKRNEFYFSYISKEIESQPKYIREIWPVYWSSVQTCLENLSYTTSISIEVEDIIENLKKLPFYIFYEDKGNQIRQTLKKVEISPQVPLDLVREFTFLMPIEEDRLKIVKKLEKIIDHSTEYSLLKQKMDDHSLPFTYPIKINHINKVMDWLSREEEKMIENDHQYRIKINCLMNFKKRIQQSLI